METFWLGFAAGTVISTFVIFGIQNLLKSRQESATDAARDLAKKERERIDSQKDAQHAAVNTFTAEELDRVLTGKCTVDDILLERARNKTADPSSKPT